MGDSSPRKQAAFLLLSHLNNSWSISLLFFPAHLPTFHGHGPHSHCQGLCSLIFGEFYFLTLLDLSSAFDRADHQLPGFPRHHTPWYSSCTLDHSFSNSVPPLPLFFDLCIGVVLALVSGALLSSLSALSPQISSSSIISLGVTYTVMTPKFALPVLTSHCTPGSSI